MNMNILTRTERFDFSRLKGNSRLRRERGLVLVEGVKLLREAVDSGLVIEQLIVTPRSSAIHADLIASLAAISIVETDTEGMSQISGVQTPPELVGTVRIPAVSFEDIVKQPLIICLDFVADPGNLGTIIRTADWFGATAFIMDSHGVDPYNDKVVRSAMGSLFRSSIWESDNLATDLKNLQKSGVHLLVTDVGGGSHELPSGPMCLVMGSESHGVSPAVRAIANSTYTIPGNGKAESLNVAVSFGIAMHQITSRE